jgi:predicted MFS family arabinose efflux permease
MALPPNRIGIVLSIIGCIGIFFQLVAYPPASTRFGTTLCYRVSLWLFPIAYFLAPFLVTLPSSTLPPLPASGVLVWAGILGVLFVHVLARTFGMPSATILVNNCCPHPSVLSTVHGVAQSVSSGMRMMGPLLGGWAFALALDMHFVAMPFWVMLVFSALAAVLALWVKEGDGHEIKLEGEEELEEALQAREKEMMGKAGLEIVENGLSRREQNVRAGFTTP